MTHARRGERTNSGKAAGPRVVEFRAGQVSAIETTGDQDLVMNVFGPNDGTRLVGSDDDSGAGLNPRLAQHLRTGKYLVRVRHYSAQKSGAYQIQARKERAR